MGRISQYIEQLHHARVAMFDDTNRKRPAPVEPTDGLDQAKRQRLGAEVTDAPSQAQEVLPPPGSRTYAWLFNRNPQESSVNFDVKAITPEIVANIVLPLLIYVEKGKFDHAINVRDNPLHTRTGYLPVRLVQGTTSWLNNEDNHRSVRSMSAAIYFYYHVSAPAAYCT